MEQSKELLVKKIFISYSRSDANYINRVRELALDLANHAMEVELDQWSVIPGDDLIVYMERMVNDLTIDKVIILLDQKYQEKADGRKSGVGAEATIITSQIYSDVAKKQGEQRFIPVVMKRDDETGKAFIPTFLATRLYIDLSNANHYTDGLEELVRVIHDKPQFSKPKPGKAPSYLLEEITSSLGSSSRARRVQEFFSQGKTQALNSLKDYFSFLIENLSMFDFSAEEKNVTADQILEKIQQMTPIRDEIIDVIRDVARYANDEATYAEIHDFLENLIRFFEFRNAGDSNHQWAADHYKFFGHELFLYTVAVLLKFRRFTQLNELTEKGYYVPSPRRYDEQNFLSSFASFNRYSEAFRYLSQRSYDSQSHETLLFKQRAVRADINLMDLNQADFILFLVHRIDDGANDVSSYFSSWYPFTLAGTYRMTPFELFLRSQSKSYFDDFRCCLRSISKEQLVELIEKLKEHKEGHNSWRTQMPIQMITGIDRIAVNP